VWTWRGEVVLPGGNRHKLAGGLLPGFTKDNIASEIPWTVRMAIDSLDLDALH
jgi:hypothetical protein